MCYLYLHREKTTYINKKFNASNLNLSTAKIIPFKGIQMLKLILPTHF